MKKRNLLIVAAFVLGLHLLRKNIDLGKISYAFNGEVNPEGEVKDGTFTARISVPVTIENNNDIAVNIQVVGDIVEGDTTYVTLLSDIIELKGRQNILAWYEETTTPESLNDIEYPIPLELTNFKFVGNIIVDGSQKIPFSVTLRP